MKKVLLITGLAVLSTSAFASKARMEALGQGTESYYAADSRSVFVNPAALNDMKNYIVTEWGLGASATGTAVADAQAAPRAEGGFFREQGTFAYGLYLGNNSEARTAVGSDTFLNQQNAVDFFLAGDMGMKWGAKLHYASAKVEDSTTVTRKNSAFGLGLGASQGDFEGYLNFDLSDKSEGSAAASGDVWKRKPGMKLGGSYKWSGLSFFADYATTSEELSLVAGTAVTGWTPGLAAATVAAGTTSTHKTSDITVGVAKIHEVNPTSRFIADLRLLLLNDEVGGSSDTNANGKVKTTKLPVTFALETDATSWLVLRGSVSQNLQGSRKYISGRSAQYSTTTVNTGATLNFGKLKLDGVIGTTDATGREVNANQGVLSTDNLMSRVAMTYNF